MQGKINPSVPTRGILIKETFYLNEKRVLVQHLSLYNLFHIVFKPGGTTAKCFKQIVFQCIKVMAFSC